MTTYAADVLTNLRRSLALAEQHYSPDYEVRPVDLWTDGPDLLVVTYRHKDFPGLFGLRRKVTRAAAIDDGDEDAAETALMVRIELEEPPPLRILGAPDARGIRWWGDPA